MKPPQPPPAFDPLWTRFSKDIPKLISASHEPQYLHWDKLRHMTPPAALSPEQWWLGIKLARIEEMLAFSNTNGEGSPFIHPIIRGIVLHFWLAYDHPFEDGNGRAARALFYWSMLRHGYWLFEFISISRIIKQAPASYGRAFLYTETDDNDLTYFIVQQLHIIERALGELQEYLARKADHLRRVELLLRGTDLNHREIALLSHAIRHPGHRYNIRSHQRSHRVAYATARADLLRLAELGLLQQRRIGQRALEFIAPDDLEERIKTL